ncbi:Ribosomal RNA small subunit methyltransferase I [Corynebacterium deserti GIMN1.010]|uniref:Ribosomal RNA small subunit methyltransferase I n=1 Tax=Corynebacterium deserti GIMN1.010 TaxID=931089 RepID=A0A0M4CII4_9CORY|nr:16S rRNA (cytidine(1402)-2'-O)-methyltransferase [Corynebacterium deserti]ALC05338.1 Ribosomal RNA small subunit methyltransferase I [Corynebacterium deserti GIMN1.010]
MHVADLTLPSGIIIAATPLGNIGDASPRLVHALANATVVAAEDTRRTASLAAALGVEISGQLVSNFDHNEQSRVEKLIEAARTGTVLVVSDAGMPVVSDPGFALIDAAHDAGISVTCFPGPSAVPTALALSGLRVGRFAFDGFAPRKHGARGTWLESLKTEKRAVCFFESPHRVVETLNHAAEVLGDRRAAVCRELSKTYEEVKRGTLPELAAWAQDGVRGEITVVIEGAGEQEVDVEALIDATQSRVDSGERLKDVCADLAKIHGVSKKELYDAVISAREI